jgi:hypothetical protein
MHRVDARRRGSIFDSYAESDLFSELDSRWSPKLRLLAQTPLRSLIKIPKAEVGFMQERHLRYFRQATVDFTFLDPAGKPLLSIEFDGIGVLRERIGAFENARRVGAKVGVPVGGGIEAGEVFHAEVWVRNIGKNHGLMPELIATQIAHLCALRRLRRAAELGYIEAVPH